MNTLYGLILAFLAGMLINSEAGILEFLFAIFCLGISSIVAFWKEPEM